MPTYSQVNSLVGGISVLIVLGSLYTFGAIIPYISSYLYYKGEDVSSLQLSIVFTLAIIMINFGMPIGSYASQYLSNRVLSIISIISLSAVVFITSYLTTFIMFTLIYGILNGLSIGFGYMSPLKNAYTHFPNRKGFCAGVCMSGFGFGSVIFNYVITELINPDNVQIDHQTKKFPENIANNLPFTLRILALIYLVLGLFGSALIQPAKKRKEVISLVTQDEEEQTTKIKQQQSVKDIFIRKKAYWLVLNLAFTVPFGMLIAFNYKEIAFEKNEEFQKEDHLITLIGSLGIFANGFCRAVWGTLFDKFSFKCIISAINITLLVCAGTILFAVKNKWTYMIIVPVIYFCYGGTFGIFPTQTVRIFGEKLGGNIYWIVFSGFSISAILQFTIRYLLISNLGLEEGYNILMGIYVGFEIIGLIIAQKIDYEYAVNQKVIIQ